MSVTRLNVINSDNSTLQINNISNENIRLAQGGGLTDIGSTTPLNITSGGAVTINNITDSSGITTGSLTTLGGFGIAKKLFTGTDTSLATVSGVTTFGSTTAVSVAANGVLTVNNTTASTNSSTASAIFQGGISIANSTEAVSVTQGGAATITGGLAVAKKVFVGGNVSFASGLNMNNTLITNVADPLNDQDVATKSYVDVVAQGLVIKESVIVATNDPGTLASSFENGDIIDGITLVTGDRILIKDQTNGVENGIYVVQATGTPLRSADFATGTSQGGAFVFVELGTNNGSTGWVVTNIFPDDVVDTDDLIFSQFSGAGQIVAGTGLTKTVNTLSVNASLTHVTAVGTLTSLTVSPGLISGVSLNLSDLTASRPVFTDGSKNFVSATVTGTGTVVVVQDTPTLITPVLGVASGTSLNLSGALTVNGISTLGNTTPVVVSALGAVRIDNGDVSTSTTTGSLIVDGGVGIAGALYAGSGNFTSLSAPHSGLSGLLADDHTQYALLAGRSGGQTLIGGTASGDDLILQSTSNVTKGNVVIVEDTDSTSISSGSFVVNGGAGIAKKLFIGTDLAVSGITSLGATNTVTVSGAGAVTIPTNLTLSALTASKPVSTNASNVLITSPTTGTGSTVVLQDTPTLVTPVLGVASGTSLNLSGALTASGLTTLGNTNSMTVSSAGVVSIGSTLGVTGLTTLSGGLTSTAGSTSLGVTTIGTTTGVTVSAAGVLVVNNATDATASNAAAMRSLGGIASVGAIWAGGNINTDSFLFCRNLTASAPTFTTNRSTGTKIVLYQQFSNGTSADYAIGVESNSTWYGVPTTTQTHKFYHGTTNTMTLSNTTLSLSAALTVTGVSTLGNTNSVTVSASGVVNIPGLTASQPVFTDSSKNLVSVGTTGSGNVVLATSPTLVTPNIGVASGTNLNLSGALTVNGISTLGVSTSMTVSATGAVSIASTLGVSGLATLNGGITSTSGSRSFGASTFTGTISGTAATLSTTLDVTGVTTLSGSVVGGSGASNNLTLRSTTNATKGRIIIDETTVSSSTTTGALTIAGGLGVAGAIFGGTLNVTGISTLGGSNSMTVSAVGAVSIASTLGVTGLSTLNGGITSTAGSRSFGASTFSGTISGTAATLSSTLSSGSSTPMLVAADGIITVQNTTNATSATAAALVVSGGVGVSGSVFIGAKNITPNTGDITAQTTFTGVQSASAATVTGLSFNPASTRSFEVLMSVVIDATVDLFAQFKLQGIYNGTSWYFAPTYLGDNTSVTFAITNAGQVIYSSSTYAGFSSLTMKFKATTLNI